MLAKTCLSFNVAEAQVVYGEQVKFLRNEIDYLLLLMSKFQVKYRKKLA